MKWPPVKITYTDNLPDGVGGRFHGFRSISIRPKYEGDIGLLEHEIEHARHWWKTGAWFGGWYRKRPEVKLRNEARAYAVQTKFPDRHGAYMTIREAATRLASAHYGFGLSQQDAETLIASYL